MKRAKPIRSFVVVASIRDNRGAAGCGLISHGAPQIITGESFFLARAAFSAETGVDPDDVRPAARRKLS